MCMLKVFSVIDDMKFYIFLDVLEKVIVVVVYLVLEKYLSIGFVFGKVKVVLIYGNFKIRVMCCCISYRNWLNGI